MRRLHAQDIYDAISLLFSFFFFFFFFLIFCCLLSYAIADVAIIALFRRHDYYIDSSFTATTFSFFIVDLSFSPPFVIALRDIACYIYAYAIL